MSELQVRQIQFQMAVPGVTSSYAQSLEYICIHTKEKNKKHSLCGTQE